MSPAPPATTRRNAGLASLLATVALPVAWTLCTLYGVGKAAGPTGDNTIDPTTTFYIGLALVLTAACPVAEAIALTAIGSRAATDEAAIWLPGALGVGNSAAALAAVVYLVRPQDTWKPPFAVQIDPLLQFLGALFGCVQALSALAAFGAAAGNASQRSMAVAKAAAKKEAAVLASPSPWVAAFASSNPGPSALSSSRSTRPACALYGAVLVLLASVLLSTILPPAWTSAAQSVAEYAGKPTLPAYSVLSPSLLWNLGGLGSFYVKLYVDVVVYFAVLGGVLALACAGQYSPAVRRVLARRVALPRCSRSLVLRDDLPPGGILTLGEGILTAAVGGLFIFWGLYWGVFYSRIVDQATGKYDDGFPRLHIAARTLGHMTTLCMSLLTFPVAKNSVWEAAFGLPFERAVRYHRMLGVACWAFVTLHMAVWHVKWAAAGMLWPNLIATGTPHLVVISVGASNGALHTRHNNPTIPLVEAAWVVRGGEGAEYLSRCIEGFSCLSETRAWDYPYDTPLLHLAPPLFSLRY